MKQKIFNKPGVKTHDCNPCPGKRKPDLRLSWATEQDPISFFFIAVYTVSLIQTQSMTECCL